MFLLLGGRCLEPNSGDCLSFYYYCIFPQHLFVETELSRRVLLPPLLFVLHPTIVFLRAIISFPLFIKFRLHSEIFNYDRTNLIFPIEKVKLKFRTEEDFCWFSFVKSFLECFSPGVPVYFLRHLPFFRFTTREIK